MPFLTPKLLTAAEEQLGYQLVSGHLDDAHFLLFVKGHKIQGFVKSTAEGWFWDYPEDVLALGRELDSAA